jgi:hypothetical protein
MAMPLYLTNILIFICNNVFVKHLIRLLCLVGVLEEEIFARFKILTLHYVQKPNFLAAMHMRKVDSFVSSQLHIYCYLCFIGLFVLFHP